MLISLHENIFLAKSTDFSTAVRGFKVCTEQSSEGTERPGLYGWVRLLVSTAWI